MNMLVKPIPTHSSNASLLWSAILIVALCALGILAITAWLPASMSDESNIDEIAASMPMISPIQLAAADTSSNTRFQLADASK